MSQLTITLPEQVIVEALNAMAATLPIVKTPLYQAFVDAVKQAEGERELAARAAVIAEYRAANNTPEERP